MPVDAYFPTINLTSSTPLSTSTPLFGQQSSPNTTTDNIAEMTDTTKENSRIAGNLAHVAGLSPDVWYLVLQNVPEIEDLASICRVCKGLYPLATRFLYRTVHIGQPDPNSPERRRRSGASELRYKAAATKWRESLALARRLADNPNMNPDQTQAVREIHIHPHSLYNKAVIEIVAKLEEELPRFVQVLSNLRRVRIHTSSPPFEAFFRALYEHPNKPEIYLCGIRPVTSTGSMPGVVSLETSSYPWEDTVEKPNTQILDIQKLFFACPDLKHFSLSVYNQFGGCIITYPYHTVIKNFQFTPGDHVTFPPLESLSLSGYAMDEEGEWPFWRGGLDWSRLKSLSLGPDPWFPGGPAMVELLKYFKGSATALRSLTVLAWAWEGDEISEPLMDFLESFDTLEELTVKRHFFRAEKLARHSKLKRLSLHCIEDKRPEGNLHPTLSAVDLALLDKSCPELEILEIDISRDASGQWPKDVIEVLASSFVNLRRLILHCEIGINFEWCDDWEDPENNKIKPFFPMLDEPLIRAFAEPFFAPRGMSKTERLTIKTGENLRRFPQWSPDWASMESDCTREFDIWLSRDDGQVKVERCTPRTQPRIDIW